MLTAREYEHRTIKHMIGLAENAQFKAELVSILFENKAQRAAVNKSIAINYDAYSTGFVDPYGDPEQYQPHKCAKLLFRVLRNKYEKWREKEQDNGR